MNIMVPTYSVNCLARVAIVTTLRTVQPGETVRLPYGIALQGLAQGVIGAIVDSSKSHDEALAMLMQYGGDSWFPRGMQTIGKLADLASVEAETAPLEGAAP